ncbi:MAG: anthranilate phosphoribosyltransferase [Bacteroidaceae bacterium]|nr:anthranilate phosphoribosyltransferase [Bacteroidaceae bacterium]
MKATLQRLLAGEILSQAQAHDLFMAIIREEVSDIQIAAILTALQLRGVAVDEILGLRAALLEVGRPVDFSDFETVDIVGTGGDGKNTFNVSTCAAFVVAGAGYKVAKHGNYSATSVSGASNVIEAHGVRFTADESQLRRSLEASGVAYLHAPLFALGMKYVAPVRKALQVPTVFNLLGPLVNPSRPKNQLLGTANLAQLRLYRNVFEQIGINYGIVTSIDGYDEISLTSAFKISTHQQERVVGPDELGLPQIAPEAIFGGNTLDEATAIFDAVLEQRSTAEQRNVVLANAAAAISLLEPTLSLTDCLAKATESLESGRALEALRKFVDINA